MNSTSLLFCAATTRPFRSSLAATLVLSLLAFGPPALAEIVDVTPNVADDSGNWSTTTVLGLEIRLNGFTGYTSTGLAADTIVDPERYRSGKVAHPQHVVRLPNAIGPDGQWHAYFAISHSGDCDPLVDDPIFSGCSATDMIGGDGYWMVAEIDADAYDHTNDRIINSADSDGRYVFEEHFQRDSPNGDWNHPAAMAVMGDALLMVGQQFEPVVPLFMGESPDALLFYDVSQPGAPVYVGKLDACQLGIVSDCSQGALGSNGRDVLSGLGLAHFENGWYHLSVGGEASRNFYCDSGVDCFKAPITIGPAGKWKDLPPSGTEKQSGGQQGQIIHSREIYSEAPGPGEPCYRQIGADRGRIVRLLGPGERDATCTPSGVRRPIYNFADHGAATRYVQGSCWPYSDCNLLTFNENPLFTKPFELIPGFSTLGQVANYLGVKNSADLDVFRRDAGIPFFDEIYYQYTDPNDVNNSGTVVSPGANSAAFVGKSRIRNKSYFTQLTGECQSGNGAHVDSNGEVLIYCVTEGTSEFGGVFPTEQPRTCPENSAPAPLGESCNILYENRPNGAPSHGVIRITEPGGKQIIYRGRRLTDVEQLNNPPWGPGRSICQEFTTDKDGPTDNCKTWDLTSPLNDPNAVDWKLALSTPGTEIRVLSGNWLYYSAEDFGGPDSYGISPDPTFYVIDLVTVPQMRSLRVAPERGIALFDGQFQRGRMLSALRDVPNLVRYCGGDETQCRALAVQNCGSPGLFNPVWYEECTYPRTFWNKTSSALIKYSSWALYGSVNFGSGFTELFPPDMSAWSNIDSGGASVREVGRGSCIKPPKPVGPFETSFPYGDTSPLLSWDNVAGTNSIDLVNTYEFVIEKEDGAIVFTERFPSMYGRSQDFSRFSMIYPRNSNYPALNVGENYRWRLRAIDVDNFCYVEGPWSDYQSLTIPEPTFEIGLTPVTNDPLGFGTGSIDFTTGSDSPASDLGSNYFTEGSVIILVATAAPDSEFVGWVGDAASCGVSTTCQLTITGNLDVQALFRPKPRLWLGTQGSGTATVDSPGFDCSNGRGFGCNAYPTDFVVNMTAAAVPGQSNFVTWAGDADCTDDDDADGNPLTSRVTLSETKACTAVFARSNYLLEARTSTPGGTVSASDSGGVITCDAQGQICTKSYTALIEETATLTAIADEGFRFVRWNGSPQCQSGANGQGTNNPINVTVGSEDVFCRAVFLDINAFYTINVQKTGAGSSASTVTGVVTTPTPADLPDVDCPLPSCTTEVASTAVVQLTATPVRGARFDGWAGGSPVCEGLDANPLIEINMADVAQLAGDLNCRANFSARVLLVDGSANGSSTGPRVDYGQVFATLPDVGGDYDVWSVRAPGSSGTINPVRTEPTVADLAPYSRVIWFTADASTAVSFSPPAGPSAEAETALGQYLEGGGCLLLSSQEYFDNRGGLTSFAQSYFGASAATENVSPVTTVSGAGLLPGFNGLNTSALVYDQATGANLTPALNDSVVADGDPDTYSLLRYDDGTSAGVGRDNGVYRSAFLGFPFLALPSGTARSEVMGTFLDYCLQTEKDDDFEANDDGEAGNIRSNIDDERATRLQGDVNLTDLKILPGNDDWYRWEGSAQADTRFEILFSHDSGDLNFDFYEGNRRDPIDSIQSTDDNELRDFFTVPEESGGGTNYYFLRVYGVDGAANSYTLRITSTFADLDNDGISNYVDIDDDGDGMSDEFEISNGFDPLFAGDASQDADNDGFTNFDESIAGTDPRDPASVPAPPSNVSPLNFFFNEICQPGAPRSLCGAISLPWLGILLED